MTTRTATKISLNQPIKSDSIDQSALLKKKQTQLAIKDIIEGFEKWQIWLTLAYQDLKVRYRRSVLGPFWITISMAITVYSMGFLYSRIFHSDIQSYFPFLVGGMLAWSLIATTFIEVTEAYASSHSLIKQIKLPYTLCIHRIVTRNILIFFHNILVIIPVIIIFHKTAQINLNTLLLIPNIILLYINFISYGLILAIIGTRYRDISQIIKSIIQVIFFLTPVVWKPDMLTGKIHYIVMFNPFYMFVELIRLPLIGARPSAYIVGMACMIAIFGVLICTFMFRKYRARIVYWL